MELLDNIRQRVQEFLYSDNIAESVMVMAAWVTAADGRIRSQEVERTERFIQNCDIFENMDSKSLAGKYRSWCRQFAKEPEDAVVHALVSLSALIGRPEAKSAIELAVAIACADGEYSQKEENVVKRAGDYLRVDIQNIQTPATCERPSPEAS